MLEILLPPVCRSLQRQSLALVFYPEPVKIMLSGNGYSHSCPATSQTKLMLP